MFFIFYRFYSFRHIIHRFQSFGQIPQDIYHIYPLYMSGSYRLHKEYTYHLQDIQIYNIQSIHFYFQYRIYNLGGTFHNFTLPRNSLQSMLNMKLNLYTPYSLQSIHQLSLYFLYKSPPTHKIPHNSCIFSLHIHIAHL
jgi:hypothetical protein